MFPPRYMITNVSPQIHDHKCFSLDTCSPMFLPRYMLTNVSPQIHDHKCFSPDTCSPSRTDLMWPYSTWTGQFSTRYFLPFHLLLMSTKYRSINFVSFCDNTFWTQPYLGDKFVANWKDEETNYNLNLKTLQDNIIPVCLPPGDISLSGKNTSFEASLIFAFPDHSFLLFYWSILLLLCIYVSPSQPRALIFSQAKLGW